MYSGGASERRLGELIPGRDVLVATEFSSRFAVRSERFPEEIEASVTRLGRLTIDLYPYHIRSM